MRYLWAVIFTVTLIWSGINPKDPFTWFLEVLPAVIGAAVLAASYKAFRLTSLVYGLILVHCIILMVGGHYTYTEVPLFDYLRDSLGFARNHYDKLGHFAQGFMPAMIAREIIIRQDLVNGRYWQSFFSVSFCLAFSAFYELIEWWIALATGEDAEAFLGTQGDVWDTQSDMAFALAGAVLALLLMSRWHDRQLARIQAGVNSQGDQGDRR